MNVKPDTYLSGNSINWQNWESKLTPITCQFCCETHGKIYDIGILVIPSIISHFNCKCEMKPMRTIKAGTVTKNGPTGQMLNSVIYINSQKTIFPKQMP